MMNDIARCHDNECPQHERCERWLDRLKGDANVVHTTSLRKPDGECDYAMLVDMEGE